MGYQVAARLEATTRLDAADEGFDVFAPDLNCAIDIALGVRSRHDDMRVEILSDDGEVIRLDEVRAAA